MPSSKKKSKKTAELPDIKDVLSAELEEVVGVRTLLSPLLARRHLVNEHVCVWV